MPVVQLELDSKGSITGLKQYDDAVDNSAKRTDSAFGKMSKSVIGIAGTITAAVTAIAASTVLVAKSIETAARMEEAQNKYNVVFDGMISKTDEWVLALQKDYALSELAAKDYLSSTKAIIDGTNMQSEAAANLSNQVVLLSQDLASFHDKSPEQAVNAMTSALTGEYEAMKQFGVVIKKTEVIQEAMRQNNLATKDSVTQAMEAQAAYSLILQKSGEAQGDTIRSQASYTFQMKQTKAIIEDVFAAIGEQLLPMVTKAITSFNDWAKSNDVVSKAGLWTVKVIHFIHDGLNGLILLPYAINAAMASMFDFMIKGFIKIITPLNLLAEGLAKIGAIENNPFTNLQIGVTDFKSAMVEAFDKQLEKTLETSASYDRLEADLTRQIAAHEAVRVSGTNSQESIKNAVKNTTKAIEEQIDGLYGYKSAQELAGITGVEAMKSVSAETAIMEQAIDKASGSVDGLTNSFSSAAAEASKLTGKKTEGPISDSGDGGGFLFSEQEEAYMKLYNQVPNITTQFESMDTYRRLLDLQQMSSGTPTPTTKTSTVNINVTQKVSRSDVVNMASELERSAERR